MPRSAPARTWQSSAPVFAALGDATRLQVVRRLSEQGPLSITELAAGSPITRQAVTKHLHVLASAGLVRSTRRGRQHVWRLQPRPLVEARRSLEAISREWDDTLE